MPTKKSTTREPENTIWRVTFPFPHGNRRLAGFLVTHGHDIDLPIAVTLPLKPNRMEERAALREARRIARRPTLASRSSGAIVIERGEGPYRTGAVPGWVYAMECVPLDAPLYTQPVYPKPFCRLRAAYMLHQLARLLRDEPKGAQHG